MKTTSELNAGIDQVREILVGSLQRNLEQRIARAESQLGARIGELQQDLRRRSEVIETHGRTETGALSKRLDAELGELKEAVRSLTRECREALALADQRISKAEEDSARAQHELREQLLQQAKSFLDELHQTRAELADTINRELSSLELEPAEEPREPREQLEGQPH